MVHIASKYTSQNVNVAARSYRKATPWRPVESAAMQPSPADGTAERTPITLSRRLARLITWFGSSRRWWSVGVAAALIAALTEPLMPALVKPLLDHGFSGGIALWMVPAAAISLFAVRGMAQFVSQYALARIANEGMHRLRRLLFARVMDAELAMFSKQSASSLSNTVVYEIQTGSMLLVQALLGLSRDGFTLVALLVYLIYLNWKLTLIVGLMVPGVAWVMKVFSKRLYHLTQLGQKTTDELAYVVEENVLAYRVVRLHGAEAAQPPAHPAGREVDHCLGRHDAHHPAAGLRGAVGGGDDRPVAKRRTGADRGRLRGLHRGHGHAHRTDPPAVRHGQPDHPRPRCAGARARDGRRGAARKARQP